MEYESIVTSQLPSCEEGFGSFVGDLGWFWIRCTRKKRANGQTGERAWGTHRTSPDFTGLGQHRAQNGP